MKPAKALTPATQANPAVEAFLARLKHPLKAEIATVRALILAADPGISEDIKWNSASFRTTEFFATVHLCSTEVVQLVFHLGAKVRKDSPEVKIADPAGLARWLAKDRCLVTLGSGKELAANSKPFQAFVREWIRYV